MSTPPKWVKRAMNLAIRRARYENASIRLPGTPFGEDDTDVIQEATRLYVDTWLIPLLKGVRDGNRQMVISFCQGENCSPPDQEKSKPVV